MGFITILSREAGTIQYGTRMVEQDRINLRVQVDLGNCSQEEYITANEITALTDGVIWFEDNFYIPTGVTTFTFTDGTTDMVATLDGTWSFDVDGDIVAYTASGSITEISDGVTFDAGNFSVPTGITEFDFKDDGYQKTGLYDGVGETWEWLHWLASTDGNTAQSWVLRLPLNDTMKLHWGDDEVEDITGLGTSAAHTITVTHDYVAPAGEGETYNIKVSGDYLNLVRLDISASGAGNGLTGDVDAFSVLTNITSVLYIRENSFSGNINRWSGFTSATATIGALWFDRMPGIEGDISVLSTFTGRQIYGYNTSGNPGIKHGDVSALITLASNAVIYLQNNSINGLQFISTAFWNNDGLDIDLSSCDMSTASIDNLLIAFAGDETTHVKNSTIKITGNSARTSNPTIDAAVAAITTGRGNTLDIT